MRVEELHAEIEAALHRACRVAWRQLQPNWRQLEADAVLAAATAAILREQPGLDEVDVLDQLETAGVVRVTGQGVQVIVPQLPEPGPRQVQ